MMANHDVIGLDVRAPADPPAYRFELVNVVDKRSVEALFRDSGPDAVVHLAAQTELNEAAPDSYDANTVGVLNILEAIRACGTVRRGLFISTQLVCHVGYKPRHDDDYAPTTKYGESKVISERLVRENDGGGAEWSIVRPTTVWGPGMKDHYCRVFRMIERGRYFHVGSKPLFKSYGYVDNATHQLLKMLSVDRSQIHRRMFYLSDYEPMSLRAWADAFQRELGAPAIRTVPEPFARGAAALGDLMNMVGMKRWPFNSFRLNNVLTEYIFDLRATQDVCGPLPFTVEDGVKETARWFRTRGR